VRHTVGLFNQIPFRFPKPLLYLDSIIHPTAPIIIGASIVEIHISYTILLLLIALLSLGPVLYTVGL
jgi:hypothetical protein